MDRNREARRASAMAASTNGVSRRRHRTGSLRDSPEEDEGPAEMHEPGRLRDRVSKKDRDRDRVSRNKRRRHDEESSEGSVSDDMDDEDEEEGAVRMLPPHPAVSNHGHNQGHGQHVQQHVSRKGYPGSTGVNSKVFKPVQGWKPADEMIGFSVPRKARSVSTKRSHENWISSAGATPEQPHRQASPSPSPSMAPLSPSSSNVSVRKKMKPNGVSKQKPPKSSSKASSSNPEELEFEIAEVLYGLMTQSQSPSKKEAESSAKFDSNRPNNESKSVVSSPISNSASTAPQLPQNSSSSTVPFSAVAPKRKKPRQVSENPKSSPISSTVVKPEIDQQPKIESLLPNSEKNSTNGSDNRNLQSFTLDFTSLETQMKDLPAPVESPVRNAPAVKLGEIESDLAVTKVNSTSSGMDAQKVEKFEIDLMAPPPQPRSSSSSPKRESEIDFAAVKADALKVTQDKEDEKASKSGRDEMLVEEPELKKAKSVPESGESEKAVIIKERNIDLQLDLEKPDRDNTAESLSGYNKSHTHVQKQQQPHTEKSAQSSSLPLSMSLASWPGGLPPMGYMAPLQGVVSMDGGQVPPTPVQPLFSQPRPKRCATHCYIARNINYLQQFMKMNPFWPAAAAGSASLFGAKPSNLNVIPTTELHGRTISSVQDKGHGLAVFPGLVGKEKASQPATLADAQGKQQHILLQQALPPPGTPPSNMLHGPAFVFPFNQQQVAAAASVRPGLTKPPNAAPNSSPVATTSTSSSVNGSAAPTPAAVSFNYPPNMPSSETQYLALLPNSTYPFPIPAPAYRGTHPQTIPFFNGSFFASQMIHPSQLQQQPSSLPPQKIQPGQQNTSISSGSSSSQKKNLQSQQQGPQQGAMNLNPFPAPKTRPAQSSQPHQARNIETEVGNEDSPSTADSRSSRGPMNVYGQNFSMPIHHQNFALVSSTQAIAGSSNVNTSQGENKKQQQSQQQSLKTAGVEPLPQTFAMSFASMNGGNTAPSGFDLSSVAQNHTMYQKFSDTDKRNYPVIQAAAVAQAAQQRKNFRVSEESKNGVGGDSPNMDEEKKGLAPKASVASGQSIAFARSDVADPSVSPLVATNVVDSSARNLNVSSSVNNRGPRSSLSNNSQHGQLPNVQFQQQQMVQIQKRQQLQQQQQQLQQQQQQLQQQQFAASRSNKAQPTSNGSTYMDYLATSSPSAGANFPNTISGFPQNLVQSSSNNSPSHSPQWKSSARTAAQVHSSSMKNLPQQQQARLQQSHTQISFGSSEKSQTGSHGQQSPGTHQSSSPPIGVSSPTNSLSKGAGGSPRTQSSNSQGNKASSLSSQPSKNPALVSSNLKTPSMLGNPHNIASSNSGPKSLVLQQQQLQHLKQQQQQLTQTSNHQPQLFFSPAYMQTQPSLSTSNTNNTSGYYLQRRYPDKQQQQQQQQGGSPSGTSAGMLSLCTPVTLASSSAADAKASSGSASNSTKGPSQSIHHQPQFQMQSSGSFSYTHAVPAGVQVKPAMEQKQPAGNREPMTRK